MATKLGTARRLARGADLLKTRGASGRATMNVNGQAAIVTGGASGLGGATASALAAAGAKVAIFDLQDELGEKKAKEIGGLYVKTNVADGPGTEASVKTVVERLGAPRVV